MTKLQERLYQYIAEERYFVLRADKEFVQAQQARNQIADKLRASMTAEQRHLFSRYIDEQNHLDSLYIRHVFQEALALVPTILHVSL